MVCQLATPVGAARLELHARSTGTPGEVRIPLDQTGIIDIWLNGETERTRTLNLYMRYDPEVVRPREAHGDIEGVNPFVTGPFMPVADEVFNASLEDKGELY